MEEWEGSLEYESKGAQGRPEVSVKTEKSLICKEQSGEGLAYDLHDRETDFFLKKNKVGF